MGKASLQLLPTPSADAPHGVEITLADSKLVGKQAELLVELRARVKDSKPVHGRRELHRQTVQLAAMTQRVDIPHAALAQCYSYQGKQLDVELVTRLKVDDGILFDSSVESRHELQLGDSPRVAKGDPKMMDPADAFSFLANLAAIPAKNRVIAIALLAVGGLVILGNMILGLHDEMVPASQTLFYSQHGSDGSESPFMKALAGSGALGAAVWAALLAQLRRYMRFAFTSHPPIRRGGRYRLSDLVEGESRVPLRNVVFRVVACNRERGQYRRRSNKKDVTRSFQTPVNAVLLCERRVNLIPAGVPIAGYLDDEVDFERMFADLYPPLRVGANHGLDVMWEVQLLHPQFVDHELVADCSTLRYEDFLDE